MKLVLKRKCPKCKRTYTVRKGKTHTCRTSMNAGNATRQLEALHKKWNINK